jgi:uncharacterized membrane protein
MARALSALAGALTIPVIYLIGRQLRGPQVGLLAAFILTISPFNIRFAQETRMYTLLTLNAGLAILALAYLLTGPEAGQVRLGATLVGRFKRGQNSLGEGVSPSTVEGLRPPPSYLRHVLRDLSGLRTDLAWLGYIFFTTATLLTHNTAVFFPLAANLFVLALICWRRQWPEKPGPL